MVFRHPNIQAYYNEAVHYLNFGTPKNNEFSIWNKWKINYFYVSQYLSTLGYLESHKIDTSLQLVVFRVFFFLNKFMFAYIIICRDATGHIFAKMIA